jgi:hypothetical protein
MLLFYFRFVVKSLVMNRKIIHTWICTTFSISTVFILKRYLHGHLCRPESEYEYGTGPDPVPDVRLRSLSKNNLGLVLKPADWLLF